MQTRYDLTPQMKAYDALQPVYVPHLHFFQPPNFTSSVVNTDSMGFRYSKYSGKVLDIRNNSAACNVLLGGSTGFGVGATSDDSSPASLLSEEGNIPCFNFCGRAFSGFQELVLFLLFFSNLNIKNVIVLSGINNLYLSYVGDYHVRGAGSVFFESTFRKAFFESHYGVAQQLLTKAIRSLARLRGGRKLYFTDYIQKQDVKDILWGRQTMDGLENKYANDFFLTDINSTTRPDLLRAMTETQLATLAAICKVRGAKLCFVLQPVASWMDCQFTSDEKRIFDMLDSTGSETWNIYKNKLADDKGWYASLVEGLCDKFDVRFIDANLSLADGKEKNVSYFVDRVHLTDQGYRDLAKKIALEVL